MLRLRNLILENFLSHKSTSIEFSDNSYIIIGENASGKTSILRGIFFALFGEDIVFGRKNLINLINRNSTSASVSIKFMMNNHTYSIERKITPRGSQQVEIRKNETLVAKGVKVSEEYLRETLGLNPETFKNTIYVPQGELVTFLEGTPKARREILNRLFGLEEIKKKNETIKSSLNAIKSELKKYEYHIEQIERLKEKRETIKKEIETLHKEIEVEKQEIIKLENLLKEQKLLLQDFEKKKVQIEGLERERELIQSQVVKTKKKLSIKKEELKKIEKLKKELPEIERKLEILPFLKQIEEKAHILKTEKEKLKNLSLKINAYTQAEQRIEDLKQKIKSKENSLKKKKEQYLELTEKQENNLKTIEKKFKEIEKRKKTYEELNQKLLFHKNRVNTLKEKFEHLKIDNIKNLEKEKDETEKLIQQLKEKKLTLKEKLKEHKERIKKLKNSKESICPTCKTPISPRRKAELIEESETFIKENETKLMQIEEEIENAERKLEKLRKTIQKNLILEEKIREVEKEIKVEKEIINKIKHEIETVNFSEEGYQETKNIYEKLKSEKISLEMDISKDEEYVKQLKKDLKNEEEKLKDIDINLIISDKEKVEKRISSILNEIKKIKESHSIEVSNTVELKREIETLEKLEIEATKIKAEIGRETEIKNEIKDLYDEIETANLKLKEIKEKIENINYNRQHHQTVKNSLTDLEERFEKLKSEHNRKRGTLTQKEKQCKEIDKEIEETKNIIEKIKTLKSTYDILKEVAEGFNPATGFIVKLREQLLPEISRICKELFEEFNFEFYEITIEEDLTVKFGTANRGSITLDQLSGGQKVAFALALRFALARKFMSAFELLILDEPTIHLDNERKKELANILMELKGKIPQMIVVTHDPELEIAGDKIIKVEKTASGSKITFTEGEYA